MMQRLSNSMRWVRDRTAQPLRRHSHRPSNGERRIKVLVTLPDLALGGGQQIVLTHLRLRDDVHFDVRLLTLNATPAELLPEFVSTRASIDCLAVDELGRLRGALRLARYLRATGVDVVHVHGPTDRDLSVVAAAITGVPVLCHLHSEWNHRAANLPTRPSIVARMRADLTARIRNFAEDRCVVAYIADSVPVAQSFAPKVTQPVTAMAQSMPISTYNGALTAHDDASWRAELGLGDGPVVINVSRFAPGKGHSALLKAQARVLEEVPDAELVLVGNGELEDALRAEAASLGIAERVHFLGLRRDIPRILVGAQVFAFASETESFGLVVAEAMAARLPVVSYHLPSIAGFVEDGVVGALVSRHDEDRFVASIVELLRNSELAVQQGTAGYHAAAARFPEDATARSFELVYSAIDAGTATALALELVPVSFDRDTICSKMSTTADVLTTGESTRSVAVPSRTQSLAPPTRA